MGGAGIFPDDIPPDDPPPDDMLPDAVLLLAGSPCDEDVAGVEPAAGPDGDIVEPSLPVPGAVCI